MLLDSSKGIKNKFDYLKKYLPVPNNTIESLFRRAWGKKFC